MTDNKIDDILYYEYDCVSLYDVKKTLEKIEIEISEFKIKQERNIDCLVKEKYGKDACGFIRGFDYSKDRLGVCFKYTWDFSLASFGFSKKDGELCIDKTASNAFFSLDELFELLQSDLSVVCDEYSRLKLCDTKFKSNIKTVNTNFYAEIDRNNVEIYFKGDETAFPKDNKFYIGFDKENRDFNSKDSSKKIISIEGKSEEDLFKKIFVNIEDCPEWMQEELLCLRQEKINAENNRIIEETLSLKQKKKTFSLFKKVVK